MEAVIRKWGNSPALRLPVAALREAGFSLEQAVNITVSRGRIVIEPANEVSYQLADLLSHITPDNLHTEVDTGGALGSEAF